jgi:type I restriction enzyme S subunit
LRANNIRSGELNFDDVIYVPESRVNKRQYLRRGDIVVAASSGSLDVVGKAAQVRSGFSGAFGAFCKVMRPCKEVIAEYVGHFLQTPDYRRRISAAAAGININNLRNEHLDDIELLLPPLDEQRRIAAILDQADDLRCKRQQALEKASSLPAVLFQEMFGDWSRPGFNGRLIQLGEKLDFLTSGSRGWAEHYRDSGSLFLRIQNVKRDELDLNDVAYVNPPRTAEAQRTRVRSGDVLLSITADLGRTAVIPEGIGEAFINQHLSILRSSNIEPRYLSAAISSRAGQIAVQAKNREGVKAGLNFDDVRSLKIPDVDIVLQRTFAARASEMDKLKDHHRSQIAKLNELFASLQHRAFRGVL